MRTATLDRLVAVVALVSLAPLLALVGLVVRLDSSGPALHRATRVGKDGRPFTLLKFRTMVQDASAGPRVTASGDARITRVGRRLRATKLDELPQLVNVARGDMRLVGWRPEDPAYIDPNNDQQVGLLRYAPGITSPASVAYRHEERILAAAVAAGNDLDEAYRALATAKASVDLEYLRQRTLGGDARVVIDTLRTVARRHDPPTSGDAEVARLDDVYRSYDGEYATRWGWDRPGNVAIAKEREVVAERLLPDVIQPVERVLDIGAGTGGGFPHLFPGAFRVRLDLLAWRLGDASGADARDAAVCADGTALPHPDSSIDVALLSVVLSSISPEAQRRVLAEVSRVVRPGGIVVVYDFRVPNLANRSTRPVSRRSIVRGLPGFTSRSRSATLAPPLARRLGRHTDRWYQPLGRLRITRTHNVVVGRRCAS